MSHSCDTFVSVLAMFLSLLCDYRCHVECYSPTRAVTPFWLILVMTAASAMSWGAKKIFTYVVSSSYVPFSSLVSLQISCPSLSWLHKLPPILLCLSIAHVTFWSLIILLIPNKCRGVCLYWEVEGDGGATGGRCAKAGKHHPALFRLPLGGIRTICKAITLDHLLVGARFAKELGLNLKLCPASSQIVQTTGLGD